MKERYDHIVVGSGISGLTVTLLLALQGKSVLLIEKGPRLGGSIARFTRQGVPFDVGFHFTGGFTPDRTGLLDDLLTLLGIRECIEPRFFPHDRCHMMAFPSEDAIFEIPCGIQRYRQKLKKDFPRHARHIDGYFDRLIRVCESTPALNMRSERPLSLSGTDEEYVSLQQVLDDLFDNKLLKALLSVFCMCHGSRPTDISFADHSRISYGLYESTARVKGGGRAFLDAFKQAFAGLDVEISCNTTISGLSEVKDRRVQRFFLSDKREVSADSCVLTIHPSKILELLPDKHISPAFQHRLEEFEPSVGFFSIFGTISDNEGPASDDSIFSIFPNTDLDLTMSPQWEGPRPMVMLTSPEKVGEGQVNTLTGLELSLVEDVNQWQKSSTGNRGEDYVQYKRDKTRSMQKCIEKYYPTFHENFTLMETASMLTYRDYLFSPFGSAYGIKQKVGQFNLVGRMPIVNLYAAGQSAMLPGVVGAITSGLFIARKLIGKNKFSEYQDRKLSSNTV